MNKRDLLLLVSLLLVSAVLIFIFNYDKENGGYVAVYIDNELYTRLSLDENTKMNIITEYGENVLVVENGEAYIEFADCPDGICVNEGKKSKTNDMIVCLPHKLVVVIEKAE